MRVLLDECLPRRLKADLAEHEVRTAQEVRCTPYGRSQYRIPAEPPWGEHRRPRHGRTQQPAHRHSSAHGASAKSFAESSSGPSDAGGRLTSRSGGRTRAPTWRLRGDVAVAEGNRLDALAFYRKAQALHPNQEVEKRAARVWKEMGGGDEAWTVIAAAAHGEKGEADGAAANAGAASAAGGAAPAGWTAVNDPVAPSSPTWSGCMRGLPAGRTSPSSPSTPT